MARVRRVLSRVKAGRQAHPAILCQTFLDSLNMPPGAPYMPEICHSGVQYKSILMQMLRAAACSRFRSSLNDSFDIQHHQNVLDIHANQETYSECQGTGIILSSGELVSPTLIKKQCAEATSNFYVNLICGASEGIFIQTGAFSTQRQFCVHVIMQIDR